MIIIITYIYISKRVKSEMFDKEGKESNTSQNTEHINNITRIENSK